MGSWLVSRWGLGIRKTKSELSEAGNFQPHPLSSREGWGTQIELTLDPAVIKSLKYGVWGDSRLVSTARSATCPNPVGTELLPGSRSRPHCTSLFTWPFTSTL